MTNLTTGQITPLNLLSQPPEVYWSPNGRYLLYGVHVEELATNASYGDSRYQFQIAVYDFQTGENIVLTETMNILILAGWSFDSQQIAFVSATNGQIKNGLYSYGQFDLYTFNINSLTIFPLTNTPDIEIFAKWSPIQNLLFFGAMPIGETWPNDSYGLEFFPWIASHLYLTDGTNSEAVVSLEDIHSPVWSLDGQQIVYRRLGSSCFLDVEQVVFDCLPDQSLPMLIGNYEPSWSSDGRWIAMRVNDPEATQQCGVVYIFDRMTNIAMPIDRNDCSYSPIYWSRLSP